MGVFLIGILVLYGCRSDQEPEPLNYPIETPNIEACNIRTTHVGDVIKPTELIIENARVHGFVNAFINPCKQVDEAPIVLSDPERSTFRMTFKMPGNYPISHLEITNFIEDQDVAIQSIHIEVSNSGRSFKRIHEDIVLGDFKSIDLSVQAEYVRLIFSSIPEEGNQSGLFFGLNDVRFHLDEGFMIEPSIEYTDPFFRMHGWTGADGIFSYNLSHARRHINSYSENIGFIFSDTFIGDVYEHNFLRYNDTIVNSTLGYYDPSLPFDEGMSFYYSQDQDGRPTSVYVPDHYIGFHPSNLGNGDGLDVFPYPQAMLTSRAYGHIWRGDQTHDEIQLDFKESTPIDRVYLWNDNHTPSFGVKTFELFAGNHQDVLTSLGLFTLDQADQGLSSSQQINEASYIDLEGIEARFLVFKLIDNYEENITTFGLGKIKTFNQAGHYLHAEISAKGYLDDRDELEESGLLWLQDSVVIDDMLYNFPILIKDNPETDFKVHKVGLSKTPIVDGVLDYTQAIYMDSPLQIRTEDGAEVFFGAGTLNMSNHPEVDDPYIYIYGYKDLNGRHLSVARVKPEHIENFNQYEFYDGETFQPDIRKTHQGIKGVSAELSVTYIPSGIYAGQYMLVSMYDTISGTVVYAVSDTPYGPFDEFKEIYVAKEPYTLNHAFTYNAKMHPLLSQEGSYVISYNVNGHRVSALQNARVYYPRFIIMTEVKTD